MSAESNAPEGDRLVALVTLLEVYERIHYPIDFPNPVEAIKFRMNNWTLPWMISTGYWSQEPRARGPGP